MTEARVNRYRQYAENARKRAQEASDKAHATLDQIPMGQPIITGRGSRTTADINRRERAWANIGKAAGEQERAQYWDRRADRRAHYDKRLDEAQVIGEKFEGVQVGDEVTACFTNCGHFYRFRGLIVRRTVNDWKVKTLDDSAPYGEAPGRVFTIAAYPSRKFSANNRVYKLERRTGDDTQPAEG
jgi:hypothetical protein